MIIRSKQSGAAIIVALFITSLVAISAIAMIERLRIDIHRTELMQNAIQANLYAEGSIAWAMDQLNNNYQRKKATAPIDLTPITSPLNTVESARISTVIDDAQRFFNINNLSDPRYHDSFKRLIRTVYPKVDQSTISELLLGIQDWISLGLKETQFDDDYSKQNPPYRAPHRPMVSISELRLIKGITPTLFAALAPYLIALPTNTKINVNSADAIILTSLSPTLTLESSHALVEVRKQTPFVTVQHFLQQDIIRNNPIPELFITTTSDYFLVTTNVTVGQQQIVLYTLLQRLITQSNPKEVVLWQSKGSL